MENKPKRTKAFIITFILILLLLLAGYFLFFKGGSFMNPQSGAARIFSSLFASKNPEDGSKTLALAGEEIKDKNSVYVTGYVQDTESVPKIFKVDLDDPNSSKPGNIYGVANQDININNLGKATITDKNKQTSKVIAEAGENIKEGDEIYISTYNKYDKQIPIVMNLLDNDPNSVNNNSIFGYANQNINNDSIGEVILTNTGGGTNSFWDSFFGFLGKKPIKPIEPKKITSPQISIENGIWKGVDPFTDPRIKINNNVWEGTNPANGKIIFENGIWKNAGTETINKERIIIENGVWKGTDPFKDPNITITNNTWIGTDATDGKVIYQNGVWKRIDPITGKTVVENAVWEKINGVWVRIDIESISKNNSIPENGTWEKINGVWTKVDPNMLFGDFSVPENGVWEQVDGVWTKISASIGEKFDPYRFPIVTVKATPSSFDTEGESTISWTSKNADSCSSGNGNPTGTEGSFKTGILNKSKMFTVVCRGTNSSSSGNAFVMIRGNSMAPKITVTATPSSFEKEGISTIRWTSTNTKSCDAGFGNGTGTSGSFKTNLINESKSFVVTCTGDNGSVSGNATVAITGINNTIRQCSDGIDNDNDGKKDTEDPNCHMDGNMNKPYVPSHFSELTSPLSSSSLLNNDGTCKNNAANPPLCTVNNNGECLNGADNPTLCTTISGKCINGGSNPPACTVDDENKCLNGADNPTLCTTIGGVCLNGASNPPACTTNDEKECLNGADNPTLCTTFGGKCLNGNDNPPACNTIGDIPFIKVTATPNSIKPGESSKITWESMNAISCNLSGGGISGTGIANTAGVTTGPLTKSTAYLVSCTGAKGSKMGASALVLVGNDFGDFPTVSATANPSSIKKGESSTITWKSSKAVVCDPGTGNTTKTEGTFETGPLERTKSFMITCSNAKGSKMSASAFVFVSTTWMPVCNDGNDNDNDKKKDILDPQCHINGVIKPDGSSYRPNHYSESEIPPGDDKKPQCSDNIDNDNKDGADIDDPECHKDGDKNNPDSYLPLYNSEFITSVECNDTVDNADADNPAVKDAADPQCHIGGTLGGNYVSTHTSEEFAPGENPLAGKTECSDKKDNDNDKFTDKEDPQCHKGGVLAGDYLPLYNSESVSPEECNDTIDNDTDKLIDAKDPQCHEGGELNNLYIPTHNSELNSPEIKNQCDFIDKNPLTFTADEKARLAVLLRKFYLISSTLKTSDDITTIYNEIDQQNTFINQLNDLTKSCYLETNDDVDFYDFCKRNPELCDKDYTAEFANKRSKTFKSPESNFENSKVTRHGNPWFTKSKTTRGTFPYTDENIGYMKYEWLDGNYSYDANKKYISTMTTGKDGAGVTTQSGPGCKVVSGYYYGTGTALSGEQYDCDSINFTFPEYQSCSTVSTKIFGSSNGQPNDEFLKQGCKWKAGVYLYNTERLLNIW